MTRYFLLNYRVGGAAEGTVHLNLGSRGWSNSSANKILSEAVGFVCLFLEMGMCLFAIVINILKGFFDRLEKMPLLPWIKAIFIILTFTFYSGE